MHCLFVGEEDVDALCNRCDVGQGYVCVYHVCISVCEEVACCAGIGEDCGMLCVSMLVFLILCCSSIVAVICNGWENSGGAVNFVGGCGIIVTMCCNDWKSSTCIV